MGFRELDLQPAYDSDEDDVLNDFYIPILSEALRYRRLAGFFSSSVLAVAARGLRNFIVNGGQMELIVSARLNNEDVEAIKLGTLDPGTAVTRAVISDIDSMEEGFVKDHVMSLAWMIAKGKLSIKVAIPLDKNGNPLDEYTIDKTGLFHQKVGVLLDAEDNMISFSGSINETGSAWLHNIEEFKVFRSWVNGEMPHLSSDLEKIKKYTAGRPRNTLVIDVPTALRDKLISIAPTDLGELNLSRYYKPAVSLRDYQLEATEKWLSTGKGLIEMATGTGKTYVALNCLKELRERLGRLVAVVTVPFLHLVSQWDRDLAIWDFRTQQVHGSGDMWNNSLMNSIIDLNNGHTDHLVIVTTHDTFCGPQFRDILMTCSTTMMLIADEVHGLGSQERRSGLLEEYDYRLGLSATPKRWLDDEGTLVLERYFGETVFRFTLPEAIKAGFLVPYEYHPHFVEMTEHEMVEYRQLTIKISRQYHAAKDDISRRQLFELLAIQRQRIVTNATNKLPEFIRILTSLGKLEHCLVYCSPQQIDVIQDLLNERGIVQHKFTAHESKSERDTLLSKFAEGTYQVLVAMMCLDEGVNVPPTRSAIFMASSGNPKQFIQRRGRILRPFPGKSSAIIHDLVVVPTLTGEIDPAFGELETRIMRRELRRLREFAVSSLHPVEIVNEIYPVLNQYKISLEEVMNEDESSI